MNTLPYELLIKIGTFCTESILLLSFTNKTDFEYFEYFDYLLMFD